MKRTWATSNPPPSSSGSSNANVPFQPPSEWSNHPFTQTYQNLTNAQSTVPLRSSPLQNSVHTGSFDPYAAGPSEKRGRTVTAGGGEGSSDGEELEDGDDDDEDEEEDETGSTKKEGGAAGKKKGKDGKAKAKLTRGSK